ncbi:uncharacterized protein LOC105218725 [Zeugodacus cucurbitae]|uniref:uncharacterized protein LOC105218725 n=1 Tax=Zeugodacus cucurbitae TaxID=28588 RepID=UPI0023D969D5|nr:uncharacterized protein LOC105218725 [Zeugodacus cucurbitae]
MYFSFSFFNALVNGTKFTTIENFRFVIGSQSPSKYYLKCANFRNNCRARAVIRKDTLALILRRKHNHTAEQQNFKRNRP